MRILLVTHYFPPEVGAPQSRLSEFARFWAEQGETVTVLTGMPNHPTGIVPPGYRRKLRLEEQHDGYRVVRTWLYATPNEGIRKKAFGHLSFMLTSVVFGTRKVGRADVVLVSSPTFFSIFSGWVLAKLKRSAFVVEVRDLWPAIFVELDILTNRHLIRILEALELWAYRQANQVVVVSEGFRGSLIDRGVAPDKVQTIHNGADLDRFPESELNPKVRRRLGARDCDTLVLYVGAHGTSQGLGSVLNVAAELKGQRIHIALVGEGAEKRALQELRERLGLTNVTMLPAVNSHEVPELLAAADICLVVLRGVPLFSAFIPSKIFEYLAAGKPVIGAVSGESREILRKSGNFVVEPENVAELAKAILRLAENREHQREMSERSRRYAKTHYDRRDSGKRYLALLKRVTKDDLE